jgi:glycosyltransferase involved in cell wall biosynthesis
MLERAFGVEAPFLAKCCLAMLNYSRERSTWRRKLHLDVRYRRSLSKQVAAALRDTDFTADFLQLGAYYDLAEFFRGRARCFSYNDGNTSVASQSPYFPKGIKRSKVEATLAYEKDVAHRLDHVFTLSEYLRTSFIEDYELRPEKVTCIGAGINLAELPVPDEQKEYQNPSLLFIGIEFKRKGGEQLLRAFSVVRERIPRATLNIVGPPHPGGEMADLPGVVWHGFLHKGMPEQAAELDRLFRSNSLFVMPSLYEPFGIAPAEAMAYSLPCVVTDRWALPEIVKSGVTGELVECGCWEQLAEVLTRLLQQPDTLARYGRAGRLRVQEEFTWTRVVDRMITAINKMEPRV